MAVIVVLLHLAAGDGVLRRRLRHRPYQEHKGEHLEGGVDRLHLQRDFTGTCVEGGGCQVLEHCTRCSGYTKSLQLCGRPGCCAAMGWSFFDASGHE